MKTYLRSLTIAQWIELSVAAIWVLGALAMGAIATFAGLTQTAPPGAAGPPPPGILPVLGAAPIFLSLAALGGGPGIAVGLVMRSERRTGSVSPTGMILAFVFGALFLAVIALGFGASVFEPNPGPVDIDFLVIGGLIAFTGFAHLVAGLIVLRGRHARPRLAAEPPRGPNAAQVT